MPRQLNPNFSHTDVAIEQVNTCYKGYFVIQQYHLKHKLFAGGWSDVFTREVFERGNAVAVLLYDVERDEVVLIRQFRVGALNSEQSPWLIELIAGVVDPDDTSAEQIAQREATEEAGLSINKLISVARYWSSPGGCSEQVQLFCGLVDASKAGGIHGLASENEDIQVLVWPRQRAYQAVEQGEINNAATIIGLQWLELHVDEIRR